MAPIGNPARWIRTPGELGELARSLAGAAAFAIDTESNNFFRYHIRVGLLQVADPDGRAFLVDPMALPDLSALGPVMADPRVEKVFHDAGNDVADLKRDFSLEFASIFDTAVAAQFCGRTRMGLDTLLKEEVGVHLVKPKDIQRCDWCRRPLSPAHERYAADDVAHLLALRDRLRAELRARNREAWAAEECEALARIPPTEARQPTDLRDIKGHRDLSRREQGILLELVRLREDLARRRDMAPFMLLDERGLVTLATARPKDREALDRLKGFSRRLRQNHAEDIFQAIRRGEAMPDSRLPAPLPRGEAVFVRGGAARRGRLKAWRIGASREAGLDPGLVLPQRLIDRIADERPDSPEKLAAVPGIRRWRVEAFGAGILAALRA